MIWLLPHLPRAPAAQGTLFGRVVTRNWPLRRWTARPSHRSLT